MRQYIARRILQIIPVLFGVTLIIFFLFKLTPGDPLSAITDPHVSAQTKAMLRHQMGLDDPIYIQYGRWIGKALKGDLGYSWYYKQPVRDVLHTYIWNSFLLAIISFVLSIILSIPIGVISAVKQYSGFDMFFTVFALFGVSIPSFFFGMALIKIFAVNLGLLPVSGMHTAGMDYHGIRMVLDVMKHALLPVIVLTLGSLASLMRYTRSSMLEVIRQDYIRTARAKGLKEKVVIYKHALRNALIPVITIFGLSLAGLFGGAIITESVFTWPGVGPVDLIGINNRDYNLIMGYNLLMAILVLIGNLIADISYAIVDPRIRLQ
ncbi:glutathione transport system permease protein GsiC [Clostridium tepidiprofundi DSM 19306]|uniref:Glutathione transport system permease protein GsiC n=1 Tax=Clostridium tepidiprofundi DSM 19306 TaxID=1121338 RepID=A0A151ATZ5_9CLOT|nr:ABC transporter permease [Clostridium tepidiprofundi]KYH30887.1 glutathione transport system permease protein GsiC [Clostridium tepidiprofundi DSM 19306]